MTFLFLLLIYSHVVREERKKNALSHAPTNFFLNGVESWMGDYSIRHLLLLSLSTYRTAHVAAWNLTSDTGLHVTLWTLPETIWLYTFMNYVAITFSCHSWLTSGNYHGNPSSTNEMQWRYRVPAQPVHSLKSASLFSLDLSLRERKTLCGHLHPKTCTSVMNSKPRRLTSNPSQCLDLNWDFWNLKVSSLLY